MFICNKSNSPCDVFDFWIFSFSTKCNELLFMFEIKQFCKKKIKNIDNHLKFILSLEFSSFFLDIFSNWIYIKVNLKFLSMFFCCCKEDLRTKLFCLFESLRYDLIPSQRRSIGEPNKSFVSCFEASLGSGKVSHFNPIV